MKEGEAILVKIVEAISERLEVKYSIRTTTKSEQFQGKKVQVLRSSILKTYQYNMIIPLQLQVLFQPIFRKYFHGDAHAWWIWMAFQLTSGEPQVLGLYHTGKSSFSCGKRNWIYFKGKPEKSEMGEIRARFGQLAEFKEMNRKQSLNRTNFIFWQKWVLRRTQLVYLIQLAFEFLSTVCINQFAHVNLQLRPQHPRLKPAFWSYYCSSWLVVLEPS